MSRKCSQKIKATYRIKQIFLSRWCAITEPELWDKSRPDPLDVANAMPTGNQRVLKTHLSYDMLPGEVMKKKNKVRGHKIAK